MRSEILKATPQTHWSPVERTRFKVVPANATCCVAVSLTNRVSAAARDGHGTGRDLSQPGKG